MGIFVGVDVGGTTSTIAIGDAQQRVLRVSDQFPTASAEGPEAMVGSIAAQLQRSLSGLGLAFAEVQRVGLATPGPATLDGVLLSTPNLTAKQWNQCPIRAMLEIELQRRAPESSTHYIGDGQAAALGEFSVRSGKLQWPEVSGAPQEDLESLFLVAVGTGLGGGEVREGQVVRGRAGRAGHAGHLMLPHDAFRYEHDRQLKVGNAYSTTESAISLTALTHQLGYRLSLQQWADHPLNHQDGSMRDKAKRLRELAAEGDPLAMELFDDQASAMGITLLMLNYFGDYDLLVIGGGVCDLPDNLRERYLQRAEEAYQQRALDGFRDHPPFTFSRCGDEASVIGALVHAYHPGETR